MKKFNKIINALVAVMAIVTLAGIAVCATQPVYAAEAVESYFVFDTETGLPASIDFEDALILARENLTDDTFGYTVGEGREITVTDTVIVDQPQLYYADSKFEFAHHEDSDYVFYGVDQNGKAIGTFQFKSDKLEELEYAPEWESSVGFKMLETRKITKGIDLERIQAKAMRAYWNAEEEAWDICFDADYLALFVAAVEEAEPEQQPEQEPVHEHKYEANVVATTCTENGYTVYTCACGYSYTDNEVAAHGHAWDNGKVTSEPTEESEGVITYTCGNCGETKTETIDRLVHEHNYESEVTEATCTESGYTTYTCACGYSYIVTGEAAHGHAWDNGVITTEPTVDTMGVITYTCGNCGAIELEILPMLEGDEIADDLQDDTTEDDTIGDGVADDLQENNPQNNPDPTKVENNPNPMEENVEESVEEVASSPSPMASGSPNPMETSSPNPMANDGNVVAGDLG